MNFKIIYFLVNIRKTKKKLYQQREREKMTTENTCVRNFEQLVNLKARSRQPIDIQSPQGGLNFKLISNNNVIEKDNEEELVKKPMVKYFSFVNKLYEAPMSLYKRETKSLDSANQIITNSTSTIISSVCSEQNSIDSGCCTRSSTDIQSVSENENEKSFSNEIIDNNEIIKIKNLCQQIFLKNSTQQQHNIKRKKNTKVLTILFDYEDLKNFNSAKFSVSKGESVYLIREFNEKYYLVLKVNNGTLGYIPKDYTIDLKEIKRKLKYNLKKQMMPNFNTKLTQL